MSLVDQSLARFGSGKAKARLGAQTAVVGKARAALVDKWRKGGLPLLDYVLSDEVLKALAPVAQRLGDYPQICVVGIGGSSLGARTLVGIKRQEGARFTFLENIDPQSVAAQLENLAAEKTALLLVSKSGGTAETLALAGVVLPAMRGADLSRQAIVITQDKNSALGEMAKRHGIPILDHPADVDGRFSVFTVTGLLPAALAGLDPAKVLAGARGVLKPFLEGERSPQEGFVASLLAEREGRALTQEVIFTYGDPLRALAMWFRQLWAESLGKAGHGITPVAAQGTVDQHSQLQLYLEGPDDKAYTLIRQVMGGQGPVIALNGHGLPQLQGRALGDLFDAEARATADALAAVGRPLREIVLVQLDEEVMGALMMGFMLETLLTAQVWGIDPFGQPAVEDGKRRALEYLAEAKL